MLLSKIRKPFHSAHAAAVGERFSAAVAGGAGTTYFHSSTGQTLGEAVAERFGDRKRGPKPTPANIVKYALGGCDIVDLCVRTTVNGAALLTPRLFSLKGKRAKDLRARMRARMRAMRTPGRMSKRRGLDSFKAHNAFEVLMLEMIETGELDPIPAHPLLDLLHQPNKHLQSSYEELVEAWITNQIAFGIIHLLAPKVSRGPNRGRPVELFLINKIQGKLDTITSADGRDALSYVYTFHPWGQRRRLKETYTPDQLLTFKNYNIADEHDGHSELTAVWPQICQYNEANLWNLSRLSNEAKIPGILIFEDDFTKGARQRRQDQVESEHQGAGNAGRTMIARGSRQKGKSKRRPVDFVKTGMVHTDMDWLGLWRTTRNAISVHLGVDPTLTGDESSATFNNKTLAQTYLYTQNIIPRMASMYGALNSKVTPMFGSDLVLWFDTSGVPALRMRLEDLVSLVESTDDVLTRGERRAILNYDELGDQRDDQLSGGCGSEIRTGTAG